MTTAPGALGLAVAVLASGCAREGAERVRWVGQVGPEGAEGLVRVVGSEPFARAVVEPDEGESVLVRGPYEREIGRLAGARVRVTGRRTGGEEAAAGLEVSSYEILSVDGDRPRVGQLERDATGFLLRGQGGAETRLAAVSDALASRAGALVWVVLDDRGGVARYGILREPPP